MKIPEFTPYTTPTDNDLLLIWDSQSASTRQIKLLDLKGYFGSTAITSYSQAVLNDNPSSYWRLEETSGIIAADSAGVNTGTYRGNCLLGQPSSLSNDANSSASFNGNTAYISTSVQYNNPQTFTLAARIKTGAVKIQGFFGFLDVIELTNASAADRNFYLDASGKLTFEIYDPNAQAFVRVKSPLSYNDNKWYSVAAVYSSQAGLSIYANGQLLANTAYKAAQSYSGYWHLGICNTTQFFSGLLDELAIYPFALSTSQIQNHHSKV